MPDGMVPNDQSLAYTNPYVTYISDSKTSPNNSPIPIP